MRWRRTDPVQEVGAMIAVGAEAAGRLVETLAARPRLAAVLPVAKSADWAVVFAASLPGEQDRLLPRMGDATPLYEAAPGWWLPVGAVLDAPDHARADLWAGLGEREGLRAPTVCLPRFGSADITGEADVYLVEHAAPRGEDRP
ncbi:hypothetical protein [Caulobacter sp. 17J65-9]|uniref:hypothetical protein n=1 Tax=Caulobacter sp. 17J65-9 TaxID=2709382 RepID=UPI0013C767D5|nr:hypothetical protein [Caulobacter sp. 17J65-9]NEX92581.1 hypothetical protein [Caulobacter sp. 17J65-9]